MQRSGVLHVTCQKPPMHPQEKCECVQVQKCKAQCCCRTDLSQQLCAKQTDFCKACKAYALIPSPPEPPCCELNGES